MKLILGKKYTDLNEEEKELLKYIHYYFGKNRNVIYKTLIDFKIHIFSPEETVEIELWGFCTDICVISNALLLRAKFPNYKITVDASCCAGSTIERHNAALEVMDSCQIDIKNS
jgi:nicotinamidase-related amidase